MLSVKQGIYNEQSAHCLIQVRGHLSEQWLDWFAGMTLTCEHDDTGRAVTTFNGTLSDQAALYGLLGRFRDLGLALLLVRYVEE